MGLLTLLLVQMFPQLLAVVAIFLLLTYIGNLVPVLGIGSQLGLILVYLGGALGVNTYLMSGSSTPSRRRWTRLPSSTAPRTRGSSSRSSCAW